ncbi:MULTISPECIES: DUF2124 family protein [unclassified Methanoregula]|uniref:DUF2124 family protein n=1 Tax=unclassified Methanoregula TaxID=2649730 RepID=UPI0009C756BE|nr:MULTISPECIES: DUF2124 family protein [unclassified Methanoregula]OPX61945.1 MAG: hypothetical protein A4E33_02542 [Methanoregula sp. PtaB.Bin085]OPY34380.1 MAG: hypothetical protein A4E34_01425 [Methanoregula sp. PtaU1.Bin006]
MKRILGSRASSGRSGVHPGLRLQPGDHIVYYGCTGTCTPFIGVLAMAGRGLHYHKVFVPYLDETKTQKLHEVPDTGMQVSGETAAVNPRNIIIMGGLAMPYMSVTKEQVRNPAARYDTIKVVGVCFQNM